MNTTGFHHITMVSADARRTVRFYRDVLGLGLVKRTVNFDDPSSYHLYFGDEQGTPGSILTWFEFAGAAKGRGGQRGVPHPGGRDDGEHRRGGTRTTPGQRPAPGADPLLHRRVRVVTAAEGTVDLLPQALVRHHRRRLSVVRACQRWIRMAGTSGCQARSTIRPPDRGPGATHQ